MSLSVIIVVFVGAFRRCIGYTLRLEDFNYRPGK